MAWVNPFRLRRAGILGMNRRNVAYIARYNERRHFPLVDDKLKTKLLAEDAGLQVPELLHVVASQHEIEHIAELVQPLDSFVIKPAQGSGGKGILVVIGRDGDKWVKSNGAIIDESVVKRHLSNVISGLHSLGGRTDVAIIEALIQINPIFDALSFEGAPDIRLIVFRGFPVMGMLRLATKASDGKANLHQGAIGVGLDIGSGRAIAAVQYDKPIEIHPDTGAALSQISVPYWDQLLLLATRCYEATNLGYLGCDIVLDQNRGPLLLELNARPGLTIQVANHAGLLPRLRSVEKHAPRGRNPERRIQWAVDNFGMSGKAEQGELPLAATAS